MIAYLDPASTTLLETHLRQKLESPERLALMQQAATLFKQLPKSAYDFAVRVKSLAEAEAELEDKLRAYMVLH